MSITGRDRFGVRALVLALCAFCVLPAGRAGAQQQDQAGAEPLTNEHIVALARAGIYDDIIISLISRSPAGFDASLTALSDLHDAGVSNAVINAVRRRAPAPPPPAKPEQDKALTNSGIVSLSQAGVSDANIISVIQKSRSDFRLDAGALVGLKKAGVSNPVIEAMLAAHAGYGAGPAAAAKAAPTPADAKQGPFEPVGDPGPQGYLAKDGVSYPATEAAAASFPPRAGGFIVSAAYLSLPMEWKYLQETSQQTQSPDGWTTTISESYQQKRESFRQAGLGIRLTKMSPVGESTSVGVEWGLIPAIAAKEFRYHAPQITAGSTVTVVVPDWGLDASTMGVATASYQYEAFVSPVLIKLGQRLVSGDGGFLYATAGVGAYVILTKTTYKEKYPDPADNSSFRWTTGKVAPAVELGLDGSFKITRALRLVAGANLGLSRKVRLWGYKGTYYDWDPPHAEHPYEEYLEMGGLAYGGKAGLSFSF